MERLLLQQRSKKWRIKMEVKEIKEEEWESIIQQTGKVLVDCYAVWCGPCKMISPMIDELAKKTDTCKFYKLNVDEAEEIAMNYGINAIPTLLVFEDGELKKTSVGLISPDELEELIK